MFFNGIYISFLILIKLRSNLELKNLYIFFCQHQIKLGIKITIGFDASVKGTHIKFNMVVEIVFFIFEGVLQHVFIIIQHGM